MNRLSISSIILPLIPSILVIPVITKFILGIHTGGFPVIVDFLYSSVTPSLDKSVIVSSFKSLLITVSIAIISWLISISFGFIIGLLSSDLNSKVFEYPLIISNIIRKLIAIPRAIHEIIWGLVLQNILGISPVIAILAISIPYTFLFSKVISDQIDSLKINELIAIKNTGSNSFSTIVTFLIPKLRPIFTNYGANRLECALRGATLLGVFGLGGIGTDLQLTIKSLQFHEMWTSLWMLGLTMLILEKSLDFIKKSSHQSHQISKGIIFYSIIILVLLFISIKTIITPEIGIINFQNISQMELPKINDLQKGLTELNWFLLISNTIILTIFSSAIAISFPPLFLIISQKKIWNKTLSFAFGLMRLIPPPLSAVLLLMFSNPSLSVAILALGIHNIGIMGRNIREGIENQSYNLYQSLITQGIPSKSAWIYGLFSQQNINYLSYGSYRMEIILKETALVGMVGGAGLGWQLQESLSSFAWSEIILIIIIYIIMTIIMESLSNKIREHWFNKTRI